MSDVLGVRLPPNAGPWGVGAGRPGSRLRFRSTGRAWERKGRSGGSSFHLPAWPERCWAWPPDGVLQMGPTKATRGTTEHGPTKVLGRARNPFSERGRRRGRWVGCPEGHPRGQTLQPSLRHGCTSWQELVSPCHPSCPPGLSPFPSGHTHHGGPGQPLQLSGWA